MGTLSTFDTSAGLWVTYVPAGITVIARDVTEMNPIEIMGRHGHVVGDAWGHEIYLTGPATLRTADEPAFTVRRKTLPT
jgi:hypothetical protein